MAQDAMLTLFLSAVPLLPFVLTQEPESAPTEAAQESRLSEIAVEFGEHRYTARQILERSLSEQHQSLIEQLDRDPAYASAFLASPRFLQLTRAFTDTLRLDELGVRQASEQELLAEAKARANELKSKLTPEAFLRSRRCEIEVRARLLAQQPAKYSTPELRRHLMRSVPEFFGEMSISWIRIPLVDHKSNRALTEAETRGIYDRLDSIAQELQAESISWEDAVKEYCKDPVSSRRKGAVGLVTRTMTDRFEEALLRALFADLGFRTPEGTMLRGPILAEKWAYLVQVDGLRIDGVPELQRERARVERSLRETVLQEQLAGIRKVLPAQVHAPLLAHD